MPNEPQIELHRRRHGMFTGLRNNFLAGLVVIAPIGLTLWVIWSVVGWIDGFVLPFVPSAYRPDTFIQHWFGVEVPTDVRGVGAIIFIVFTVFVGWITKGLIGRSFLRWGEELVGRMPIVRSIYNGVKQIAETVFAQSESNFDKACLIEYPRKGIWAVAFISTKTKGEVAEKLPGDELVTVFLPTTPNPTSGFLLFLPKEDVRELDMTVEDAAKLVISAGLVYPDGKSKRPSRKRGKE